MGLLLVVLVAVMGVKSRSGSDGLVVMVLVAMGSNGGGGLHRPECDRKDNKVRVYRMNRMLF